MQNSQVLGMSYQAVTFFRQYLAPFLRYQPHIQHLQYPVLSEFLRFLHRSQALVLLHGSLLGITECLN